MPIVYSEFNQKVVFITGVSSGIGAAQANAFLKQGAFVFGLDCQIGGCDRLKIAYPDSFSFYIGDITDQSVIKHAVDTCCHDFGELDILLNTVGVLDEYKPLLETTSELWDHIYDVNLKSLFNITRYVLPNMLERNEGTIINMASIAGLIAGGGGCAYTSMKHGIVGFTKQLALDYANQGIKIKGIAPGAIETPMNAADFSGDGKMAKWVAEETPVKRWAQPEEVADLTLFLASEHASYMQGVIVPIDGGWMLK